MNTAIIRRSLLKWFDAHLRPMPWRHTRDAYRIWVSEVMLQQTTVAAVIPFYNRFMTAFPTVTALAAAPEQDVLKLWEGLGYYRRARHLHAAAKKIVHECDGVFPDDVETVSNLPGVGRYILGAVLSQAFEQRLPIVEANSVRLLARLFAYRGDPRVGAGNAWAWQTAKSLLPRKRIGDFNQALMELGSQVCTPVNPKCDRCPLRRHCQANQLGLQAKIPPPKSPKSIRQVTEIAAVIRNGDHYLMVRCSDDAPRWAGMWEFPRGELIADETPDTAAARIAKAMTGITIQPGSELITFTHTVTRHEIRLTAMHGTTRSRRFQLSQHSAAQWVTPTQMHLLPASTPQRRIIAELSNPQKRLF